MGKKLYVGNLTYTCTEADLKTTFEAIGPVVSVTIIADKFSGRSKGFGFVEMENEADAEKAVASLNNSEFSGRKIVVNEARPMTERPARRSV
ncbi:RNA-binding protein [Candidatus Peregrinibacteria bacterium]|nr:RNA-binding protein [Candidatus Peregrinibacteria bacterium]